ncbi:hypothetical protein AB0H34_04850 [Saccharopolyspora shandongensis]|uniref:DUF3885 domain-containing protein n=1 Tax=Saccharopolyspora shandongensis TaxID=418495 RepID=UPI0033D1E243
MAGGDLLGLWQRRWPLCPPLADGLKHAYRDRWVRFHSLPGSKRYPDTADEYTTLLDRHNTILDELFTGQEVYLITCDWSDSPEPGARPDEHARLQPDARHWTSVRTNPDETDPDFVSYTHLFVSRIVWRRGAVDDLLRSVADDVSGGGMIADSSLERIHHPYDGGSDVLLPTTAERDVLRHRYARWLSSHPEGF